LAGYLAIFSTGICYPAGYPAIEFGIRPDSGYQKRPKYPAEYPARWMFGASLQNIEKIFAKS
jgi:hypothetical protein